MDRDNVVKALSIFALISVDREAIECVANYVKLGGEINDYVMGYVDKARVGVNGWIQEQLPPITPPPRKRKYTRQNKTPALQDENNNTIKIYCEGLCSNIGKPNAKAGFSVFCHITVDGDVFTRDIIETLNPEEPQSNQRAELRALYSGILLANEMKTEFPTCNIELIISSMYASRCVNEWGGLWKQKEWKGVKHVDIIRPMIEKNTFPCRLIKKDSELAGYKYARNYAIQSVTSNLNTIRRFQED